MAKKIITAQIINRYEKYNKVALFQYSAFFFD